VPDLAGPERHDLADLVSQVARARRVRTWVVPVRLPGRLSRGLATGALLPEADADIGRQTFAEWLAVNLRPKLASTGRP
jgi:hypothetical protein